MTFVTPFVRYLSGPGPLAYDDLDKDSDMRPKMICLTIALRLTSAPLFVGALVLGFGPRHTGTDLAAGAALVLLGVIQLLYWWRPWPIQQRRAAIALVA